MKKKQMENEIERLDSLVSQLIADKESDRNTMVKQEIKILKMDEIIANILNHFETKEGHLPDGITRRPKTKKEN